MEVFELYMAYHGWNPESEFILMEYGLEIWKGNWFNIPGCYYKRKVYEFGTLTNGTIWIELKLE